MRDRLLLVEDRDALRRILSEALAKTFDVDAVADAAAARAHLIEGEYTVVITDVRLPIGSGVEVLAAARALPQAPEVVLMSAYAAVPDAVAALKAGAYDYLQKPIEPDTLVRVALRAADRHHLVRRARELEARVVSGEGELIGRTPPIQSVRLLIDRVAPSNVPVLLTGETGTGKEVVAREIHRLSGRRAFIAVNCAAIPENLLESEMFGVVKGAFTGASADRPGLVEAASGGTLFLDEIGDLPLLLQVKLNRLLEEGEFRRVGDAAVRKANFRLVAATHASLDDAVKEGGFRSDLLFRLKVMSIRLPALRDRREDISLLAARFLGLAAARFGTRAFRLAPEALGMLEAAEWPGNVRELRHALEHAAVLADGDVVEVEHLPDELRARAPRARAGTYRAALERASDAAGREYLLQLLTDVQGNVTRAAIEAGIERESMHRLLRRHGLDPARFRGDRPGSV